VKHYRSTIPAESHERIVSTHKPHGPKFKVECVLHGKVVGIRFFDKEGHLELETPLKDGVAHGTQYYFDSDSDNVLRVVFAEPYRNGLAHGTARQWTANDGKPLGTYTMKHGTGLDVWRTWSYEKKSYFVSEARYIKEGKWHGFEWWISEDNKTVVQENHFREDLQHGIMRRWNGQGKLRRGYPKYWVQNEQLTKRKYLKLQRQDPTLPAFNEIDNSPQRAFPKEVKDAIRSTTTQRSTAQAVS
jgi:antitoxin component YwqK of YwqJK toxin-antitoxin module